MNHLRATPTATARELARVLDASQPTVSRLLQQAGEQVVAIGQARARRYAAARRVRGLGSRWPLYRIDYQGRPERLGMLTALHRDRYYLAAAHKPAWLRDEFSDGLFPGLPWFLDDMRPQGFLGRALAHHFGPLLGLRDALALWNDDDVLTVLLRCGQDMPGQFVLGEAALEAALTREPDTLAPARRKAAYVHLAEAATAGAPPGSSAAGEQPKFTACIDTGAGPAHVIVKFSDPVDAAPAARRWADLLRAEHVANRVLAANGIAVVQTEVIGAAGRRFLQSIRFDRNGAHGRRGIVSLAALDDAHFGQRDTWARAASRLTGAGWITADDAERMTLCWWFGRLIGNTDMHFGNLGFYLDDGVPLALAPIYDMLPMYYRPAVSGAIERPDYAPPPPVPEQLKAWRRACRMAQDFWQQLSAEPDVSPAFRDIAHTQQGALANLHARFG